MKATFTRVLDGAKPGAHFESTAAAIAGRLTDILNRQFRARTGPTPRLERKCSAKTSDGSVAAGCPRDRGQPAPKSGVG